MRRLAIIGAVLGSLLGSTVAQASHHWRAIHRVQAAVAQPSCPAGVPVQNITVINQANVRPVALATVERAVVDQSLQLRASWGTPCVQFGPGGWKLYLKTGAQGQDAGMHFWDGSPYILVWTGGVTWQGWSAMFSHEIVETLVDPNNTYYSFADSSSQLEVADPVEHHNYPIDGVYVADFVTPNWYAGATLGVCSTVVDQGISSIVCSGPLLSSAQNTGPWDQAHALTRAWQITQS